jgi:hypothetical protein
MRGRDLAVYVQGKILKPNTGGLARQTRHKGIAEIPDVYAYFIKQDTGL